MKAFGTSCASVLALLSVLPRVAEAAPTLRVQVDQHGDFLQIGNTLGLECAAGTPAPVVGTVSPTACNQPFGDIDDSSPDVFWASDDPGAGQALASQSVNASEARSTAMLTVPTGATVTHAFLYWAAQSATAGTQITLDRPGNGGFSQTVPALQTFTVAASHVYQSVADVTSLVQQNGDGAYRVSGISVDSFVDVNDSSLFGGWSLIVLYERASDPLTNLAIFDGLDPVSNGNNQNIALSGFLVPNAGFTGKLGVTAYEGDNSIPGDQLFFNGGAALSDAQNPADNFFNGTRSFLGAPVSVVGDLPQLTGTPQSMAGMDLDVVDITSKLTAGESSATVQATSSGDSYYLGALVTSIPTFEPDFSTSTKTATDVNGGSVLAGDVIAYTITTTNTGDDASVGTVLTDVLPTGVTYVPGSIEIASGPNAGPKTDAVLDDQAEYDAATSTLTVRLGAGANAVVGGSIAAMGSSAVTFQVRVNQGALGDVANQASINASGFLGAPAATALTDGNGAASGNPPTTFEVDGCATNQDCAGSTAVCDTSTSPKTCVGCVADKDCGDATSGQVCDDAALICIAGCRGKGGNGCPDPATCTSTDATIGQCIGGTTVSSSATGEPSSTSNGASTSTGNASSGEGGAGGTNAVGVGGNSANALLPEGSGISCRVSPSGEGDRNDGLSMLAFVIGGAIAQLSRRRSR